MKLPTLWTGLCVVETSERKRVRFFQYTSVQKFGVARLQTYKCVLYKLCHFAKKNTEKHG